VRTSACPCDCSGHLAGEGCGPRNFDGRIQQREDPLRRSHRSCRMLNFSDMSLTRPEETAARTARNATSEPSVSRSEPNRRARHSHPRATAPDDKRRGERAHQPRWPVRTPRNRRSSRYWPSRARESMSSKAAKSRCFAAEQLHRGHAGDALLEERVDPRNPRPHARYDSRTLTRNHCVTITMSGRTEKATAPAANPSRSAPP
jgi:hypothetical protein